MGFPRLCEPSKYSSRSPRKRNSVGEQKVGGINDKRVRSRPRSLEADPRNITTDVQISECQLCDTLSEKRGAMCIGYPTNLDDDSLSHSPLSYGSSSEFESFSSFESASFNRPNDTHNWPNRDAESQTPTLCGVGQWVDGVQVRSCMSWQSFPPPMDDVDDPKLDLMGIHTLAATCPFEYYLRTCQDEEGAMSYQMYASLP